MFSLMWKKVQDVSQRSNVQSAEVSCWKFPRSFPSTEIQVTYVGKMWMECEGLSLDSEESLYVILLPYNLTVRHMETVN